MKLCVYQRLQNSAFNLFKILIKIKRIFKNAISRHNFSKNMCETLDEIHAAQLAAIIEKMRKQRAKERPIQVIAN